MTIKIAPSLLAADFSKLEEEIATVSPHIDWLHLDIMDGHFVPNISFGIPVIASIRPVTDVLFDCHIMTTNPAAYLEEISEAGGDLATVHIEAVPDPVPAAEAAKAAGLRFGLVVNPRTPFQAMAPYTELCDVIVVMSVEPGFGGQTFIPEVLPKVEMAREWVEKHGLGADIQVDGGVTTANAGQVASAGASVLVAGSAVFRAPDPIEAVNELRRAASADE